MADTQSALSGAVLAFFPEPADAGGDGSTTSVSSSSSSRRGLCSMLRSMSKSKFRLPSPPACIGDCNRGGSSLLSVVMLTLALGSGGGVLDNIATGEALTVAAAPSPMPRSRSLKSAAPVAAAPAAAAAAAAAAAGDVAKPPPAVVANILLSPVGVIGEVGSGESICC
ncbi:CG14817 [Drosophila busckii]|uniref:CG14817 n=1 Tax=Drosophila busckii TaxID=30019 RepID=A0A0M3QZK1_DROBS|nr:CG14817 [Drosophila busckii]